MNFSEKKTNDIGAAVTLMVLAPMITEVLPGATRFSSIFVFPIEICVWGGGALMIRYAVRHWKLGWLNMLFLAIALAIAEECLIQQTSLAPLVIRLKGVTYARAFGINYVYLLWALIYEPVLVVFVPVYLTELIFPDRKERPWISKAGFFAIIPLFLLGSLLAWFSWTQIARTKVFHLPAYHPPVASVVLAFATIIALLFLALFHFKKKPAGKSVSWKPPVTGVIMLIAALWTVPLYGLVLLGFGIAPGFPPLIAICLGIMLFWIPLFLLPRWTADVRWQQNHFFALLFGILLGSMVISFIGFIDSGGPDLYFKIIINIIAVVLMILLGLKIKKTIAK